MTNGLSFKNGIISALVLPFTTDYKIDERSLRKLVDFNLSASRINGICCNAYAGETFSLTSEERRTVIRIIKDQVGGRVPVVPGVWAEGLDDVKRELEYAQEDGADAILLFAPMTFARGATHSPEIPVKFHREIAKSSDVPIIGFQTRLGTGTCYSSETMAELSKIDKIIAIKNACFDLNKFEADTKAIKESGGSAEVLTGCDTLLASTMYLSDGALLGLASLTPNYLSLLMEMVKDGNLNDAYALQEKFYALISAVYAHPAMDIPGRMKSGLVDLGIIDTPIVREPWTQLSGQERQKISSLIANLGIKEL